jgi:hypothetical protein
MYHKKNPITVVKKGNYTTPTKRYVLNGLGAPIVSEDFGGMGAMGFDLSAAFNDLLSQGTKALQTSVTQAVTTTIQKQVLKLTGADGKVTSVTLTPEQAAAYQKTGVVPAGLLPQGFILPPKSFMQEYGQILTYAGIGLAGIIAIALVVKMVKK